jgi:hypothetical protein
MPTVEDTRIDEIGKIILDHRYEKDPRDMNALKYSSYLIAKKILEYMAPTIEKAEKWDKMKECARLRNTRTCDTCPLVVCEDVLCTYAKSIVEALEGGQNDKP